MSDSEPTPLPPTDIARLRALFEALAGGVCVACGAEPVRYALGHFDPTPIHITCAACGAQTRIDLWGTGDRHPAPTGVVTAHELRDGTPLTLIEHRLTWRDDPPWPERT